LDQKPKGTVTGATEDSIAAARIIENLESARKKIWVFEIVFGYAKGTEPETVIK